LYKIKNIFESIKQKHSEAPYTAVFLHIVGHAPKCDNEGFYQFDVGNDCFIHVNEIKMLLANFASCCIIIMKDFCYAEAHDLLSNLPIEPKQFRLQWSACAKDGYAYKAGDIPGRLFSNCLATGFDGQNCPINNTRDCDVCKDYRNSENGSISYNILQDKSYYKILQDKWVEPHVRKCTEINRHYPVLNIHESCQEMFHCSLKEIMRCLLYISFICFLFYIYVSRNV